MFAPPHRMFAANVANAVGHINNVKHAHGAKKGTGMNEEMICPYCQRELLCIGILHAQDNHTIWYCPKCATEKQLWRIANKELWQSLIQSQRDLKIARQALEEIKDDIWSNRRITARTALEQITHDNKD